MAGLIDVGVGYKNAALSGFVRESAIQQQIDQANAQLAAQRSIQGTQMGTELGILGGSAAINYGPSIWAGAGAAGTAAAGMEAGGAAELGFAAGAAGAAEAVGTEVAADEIWGAFLAMLAF